MLVIAIIAVLLVYLAASVAVVYLPQRELSDEDIDRIVRGWHERGQS